MPATTDRSYGRAIHPVHAFLLASTVPLFLGALLSDWAYSSTYEVQWINFASWLNAGALLFAGLAMVWAIIDLFRADLGRDRRTWIYALVLLATFVLGFVAALTHARDAWGSMPESMILSFIVAVLAVIATWLGFSSLRAGVEQ